MYVNFVKEMVPILEDEYHFVLCCPAYADLRSNYLSQDVINTPSYSTFIELLKKEDEYTQKNISSFIVHAYKLRVEKLASIELQ